CFSYRCFIKGKCHDRCKSGLNRPGFPEGWVISLRQKQKKLIMLPSETMIWQPEFTDKTLSRKTGAVQTFQRWLFFSVNTSVRVPHTCSLVKSGGLAIQSASRK
ncbi:TPA: hypothetical protein ACWQ8V_005483, partial [Escherichia coli]